MRLLKIWPVSLAVGILATVFWTVYYAAFGHVPSSLWCCFPSYQPRQIFFSRWFDIPSVMILVAVFIFLIQRLFRHLVSKPSVIIGLFMAVFAYGEHAARSGWASPNALLFVTVSIGLISALLGLFLRFTEAGPASLCSLFGLGLIAGCFIGFPNAVVDSIIGLITLTIGLAVGCIIRSAAGFISRPIHYRAKIRSSRNRPA